MVHYLGALTMYVWKLTKRCRHPTLRGLKRFEVTQPLHHAGYYEDVRGISISAMIRTSSLSVLAAGGRIP
jgi:hypothetical protein